MNQEQSALEIELNQLRIISDFAIDMLSIATTEQVLWHLARDVVARLGFTDVVIYLFDRERQSLIQKAAFGSKSPEAYRILSPIEIGLGQGVVGKAALDCIAVVIDDTRTRPDYIRDVGAGLSEMAVPMRVGGELVGVIDSEHQQTFFYTEQHLKIVEAIASIAATKILQTQTLFQLHETITQLEYSSKIQDVLFEIAELIFETDSMQEFYRRLHSCIARLTFAKNFFVAFLNEDNTEICLPYCADELDQVEEGEVIPLDLKRPSLTGYVLMHGEPQLLHEDDIVKMVEAGEIHVIGSMPMVWLAVPFGSADSRGVVVVQSYTKNDVFTEKDKSLLLFVSKHIQNAIERIKSKSDLNFLALHDPLTKLPNRILFSDRVDQAVVKCTRVPFSQVNILFVDLDRFKQVNDTHGHSVGDALLIKVAEVISSQVRLSDTLCRLGGDEFAILLETVDDSESVAKIANSIVEGINNIEKINDRHVDISASIGVSCYKDGMDNASALLQQADEAMYQAKLLGRNQVYFYSENSPKKHSSSHRLERDFKKAVERSELHLDFQPIVRVDSGLVVGAEALVRWMHPDHGLLLPESFIGLLEKTGQITLLDQWVIKRALDFLTEFEGHFSEEFRLNVNISGVGFTTLEFLKPLQARFAQVSPCVNKLCVEITESSLVVDVLQATETLNALRELGVLVAIDDFGTGYSSLGYLHHFSFDCLKIDRSFIHEIGVGHEKSIILQTILNLARSLNIETVAEGVEFEYQLDCLVKLGCTKVQGYYLSRPLSQQRFMELLDSGARCPPNLVS